MVGVWLIVLASFSTPQGKVPCLILKKTSRRTQADVVSEGIFCAARCCVMFYLQSMKVYLHIIHVQRELSAEPFMPSILPLRIFCTAVLSRCKFSPPTVCLLCFLPIHSGTSSSLDVTAGVPQEEGHTGVLIHLLSAVRALILFARRIQPFFSLVDREVELCVLTI